MDKRSRRLDQFRWGTFPDGQDKKRDEEKGEKERKSETETDGQDRRVTGVPSTPRRIETFGHLYKDENSGGGEGRGGCRFMESRHFLYLYLYRDVYIYSYVH